DFEAISTECGKFEPANCTLNDVDYSTPLTSLTCKDIDTFSFGNSGCILEDKLMSNAFNCSYEIVVTTALLNNNNPSIDPAYLSSNEEM
ncbi:1909_t:CDS:2, partial [Racocetra persica]